MNQNREDKGDKKVKNMMKIGKQKSEEDIKKRKCKTKCKTKRNKSRKKEKRLK